jgi:hypothetical protein
VKRIPIIYFYKNEMIVVDENVVRSKKSREEDMWMQVEYANIMIYPIVDVSGADRLSLIL